MFPGVSWNAYALPGVSQIHQREPAKADKEPLRPVYQRYKLVKTLLQRAQSQTPPPPLAPSTPQSRATPQSANDRRLQVTRSPTPRSRSSNRLTNVNGRGAPLPGVQVGVDVLASPSHGGPEEHAPAPVPSSSLPAGPPQHVSTSVNAAAGQTRRSAPQSVATSAPSGILHESSELSNGHLDAGALRGQRNVPHVGERVMTWLAESQPSAAPYSVASQRPGSASLDSAPSVGARPSVSVVLAVHRHLFFCAHANCVRVCDSPAPPPARLVPLLWA